MRVDLVRLIAMGNHAMLDSRRGLGCRWIVVQRKWELGYDFGGGLMESALIGSSNWPCGEIERVNAVLRLRSVGGGRRKAIL